MLYCLKHLSGIRLQLQQDTLPSSSHFKSPVGSVFNAISRLSVVKRRCLLSSCYRMAWQEAGIAFFCTLEEHKADALLEESSPVSFVTS